MNVTNRKKVLIFSNKMDFSTNKACEWLNWYNCEFTRINELDFDSLSGMKMGIELSNCTFQFHIESDAFSAV